MPQTVSISSDEIIDLLRRWHTEWDEWRAARDATPLNHVHRRIHEGMCNTQMARIGDLHDLLKKHGVITSR